LIPVRSFIQALGLRLVFASKKKPLFLVSAIAGAFVAANILLSITKVRETIFSLNPVSYFYIGHDWRLKLDRLLLSSLKDATVFVGTSRSIYALEIKEIRRQKRNIHNFSLMAASQKQILFLLKALEKKGDILSSIVIEVNPMSISKRHIDSISTHERESALEVSSFDYYLPVGSLSREYFPLLRYSSLIRNSFKSLLRRSNQKSSKLYAKRRNEMHMNEFRMLDNPLNGGSVAAFYPPGELGNKTFRERLTGECMTMLRWSYDTAQIELNLYRETLELAKKIARRVILWSPPFTQASFDAVPADYMAKMNTVSKEFQLKINYIPPLVWEDENDFIDCIHLSLSGSKKLTKPILRWIKSDSK